MAREALSYLSEISASGPKPTVATYIIFAPSFILLISLGKSLERRVRYMAEEEAVVATVVAYAAGPVQW